MLPDTLTRLLGNDREHEPSDVEASDTGISKEEPFIGRWGKSTSIFGTPVMSPRETNQIIDEFIEQVERIEDSVDREIETSTSITPIPDRPRIHEVKIFDVDGKYWQEYLEQSGKRTGTPGGHYIARATYSVWNDYSPVDLYDLPHPDPGNLPVPRSSIQDKVFLEIQAPDNAPESKDLRSLMDELREYDTSDKYLEQGPHM